METSHNGLVFGTVATTPPTITFSTFPPYEAAGTPEAVRSPAEPEPPRLRLVQDVRGGCNHRLA